MSRGQRRIQSLDFWWNNDAVEVIAPPIEFEGSTDMKSKVGADCFKILSGGTDTHAPLTFTS
jgi:hypothetical protein